MSVKQKPSTLGSFFLKFKVFNVPLVARNRSIVPTGRGGLSSRLEFTPREANLQERLVTMMFSAVFEAVCQPPVFYMRKKVKKNNKKKTKQTKKNNSLAQSRNGLSIS